MKNIASLLILSLFIGFTWASTADNKLPPSEQELSAMVSQYPVKPQHKSLSCTTCHGANSLNRYYLTDSETCLKCHSSREIVAERTKALDANNINPHRSFHSGTATECYECHRQHRPSRNYCGNCHDVDLWMKPVP